MKNKIELRELKEKMSIFLGVFILLLYLFDLVVLANIVLGSIVLSELIFRVMKGLGG